MLELSNHLAQLAENGGDARAQMGDVLLRMTSLCRLLGIEAEEALTAAVEKTIAEIS
jgi:NTP pyrophosphatase (non-canonical NTP hydrolase)